MQIKLNPADVNAIIMAHLKANGVDTTQPVQLAFRNKRNKGGMMVDVTIGTAAASTPVVEASKPVAEAPVTADTTTSESLFS